MLERIYNNVKFLCKFFNINIGDLEKKIEVSPGYISRIAKSGKDIGITKAQAICEFFCITIPELIENDYEAIYEKQLLKEELAFVEKRENEIRKRLVELDAK